MDLNRKKLTTVGGILDFGYFVMSYSPRHDYSVSFGNCLPEPESGSEFCLRLFYYERKHEERVPT